MTRAVPPLALPPKGMHRLLARWGPRRRLCTRLRGSSNRQRVLPQASGRAAALHTPLPIRARRTVPTGLLRWSGERRRRHRASCTAREIQAQTLTLCWMAWKLERVVSYSCHAPQRQPPPSQQYPAAGALPVLSPHGCGHAHSGRSQASCSQTAGHGSSSSSRSSRCATSSRTHSWTSGLCTLKLARQTSRERPQRSSVPSAALTSVASPCRPASATSTTVATAMRPLCLTPSPSPSWVPAARSSLCSRSSSDGDPRRPLDPPQLLLLQPPNHRNSNSICRKQSERPAMAKRAPQLQHPAGGSSTSSCQQGQRGCRSGSTGGSRKYI